MSKHSTVSSLLAALLVVANALVVCGAPVVRTAAGANAAAIQATVDQFRADLGGAANGVGGSFTTGRREINWDGVPDASASPHDLPLDFFNVNSPRGVVLDTNFGEFLRVSANASNPTNTPVRFGDIDPAYPGMFPTFSAQRLFAPVSIGVQDPESPLVDVLFFIPGTKIRATVSGFGVVFTDVDDVGHAFIICYGRDGLRIPGGLVSATAFSNGLSFAGISFNAGERIARVRVIPGSRVLAQGNVDSGGTDIEAMDDFIYGEPRAAEPHSADFDGDGTADLSIFRPSNGNWFILNSGTNTVAGTTFGQTGDIPVDGDFDGDDRNDVCVFRPSTGQWFRLNSTNNLFVVFPFGLNGDRPVPGDYDKDGKTDISVWRPSNSTYFINRSSDGAFAAAQWGAPGDIPIGASPQ